MKLWKKMCVYFLSFFIVVFLAAGILLIEKSTRSNLDKIISKAAAEQNSISNGMIWYAVISEERNVNKSSYYLEDYIVEYLKSRISSEGVYFKVLDSSRNIIYSNMNFELPIEEVELKNAQNYPQYVIRKNYDKAYLSIYSTKKVKTSELTNCYIFDISYIYEQKEAQYSFFLKIFLAVTVVLGAGVYILSKNITKSVCSLTESVIKIEEGNYADRVMIQTKDEIGTLALHYNRMADAIQEKIAELQEKTDSQQRFIDNFTHELRTPLTAIIGYSDYIRSADCSGDQCQEMGHRIFSEGKRIEKLSSMMMDLVFLEHNQFKLTGYEMKAILWKVNNIMTPALQQKGMSLNIECKEKGLMILAEQNLILNLFCNLLDNSIKASECNTSIVITAEEAENYIVIEMKDQGKGIPEEDIAKVFENFYMVDKVRNKENNGIGLGLSICLEISRIHNAVLELESEVGKGTTVRIKFIKYENNL